MPCVTKHDADLVAPFGRDRVTGARDGATKDVEARPKVPDTRWSERVNAFRQRGHDAASARMSLRTPAAVTAGPAPGPVMMSGFV